MLRGHVARDKSDRMIGMLGPRETREPRVIQRIDELVAGRFSLAAELTENELR